MGQAMGQALGRALGQALGWALGQTMDQAHGLAMGQALGPALGPVLKVNTTRYPPPRFCAQGVLNGSAVLWCVVSLKLVIFVLILMKI